jgi:hypothetical protein
LSQTLRKYLLNNLHNCFFINLSPSFSKVSGPQCFFTSQKYVSLHYHHYLLLATIASTNQKVARLMAIDIAALSPIQAVLTKKLKLTTG